MVNPFIEALERILINSPGVSWTEHQLLGCLVEEQLLSRDYGRDSLALFQAHFIIMNGLYQLADRFDIEQQGYLSISALSIVLNTAANDSSSQQLASNRRSALAQYYLDWENFSQASPESVDALLNDFWTRYVAQDERHDALALLGLQDPVTYIEVKRRYREQAMALHPDRGGSNEALAQLNNAMEVLKRYYA